MKKTLGLLISLIIIIVIVLWMGPFFILDEGTQAVVTRFGKIEASFTEAGLHFKMPFVDTVTTYPKKILSLDGDLQRIPTKEKQYIIVDTTSRWRIIDPKLFYETMQSVEVASSRIGNIIDSATRTVITSNSLNEIVRNSNIINELKTQEIYAVTAEGENVELEGISNSKIAYEEIQKGREQLSTEMAEKASQALKDYGIELLDIVPRQIKYSDDLTESVYNRMIKERNQIAQAIRSTGEGQKANLLGKLENEKKSITSEAYARSEKIKAEADAEAAKIYAQAYRTDPEFYAFWKSLESYKETIPGLDKTLSTDMDYFKYLYSSNGKR